MTALTLGLVAGEASGDLLAASVLDGLKQRFDPLDARGIGGPALGARGFGSWWSIDALSVRGYVEVLREYPRLRRMRNELRDRMIAWRPSVFVGVDAPDFNLDLEIACRRAGLKVAHFISPSIWAWRRERIHKIRQAVDHMLLVFPFEKQLYDEAGIAATYVGHPLADLIPLQADGVAARLELGLPARGEVVALLPGSRPAEIQYMAQTFIEAAAWLAHRRPDISFVLPAAGAALYERLRQLLATHNGSEPARLMLVQGRSHLALAACDAVLVASGTASLEAALFRKPMVIAYKMPWLSYRIMRNKGYQPYVGLPNILLGEHLVPEFIQQAATPQALGQAMLTELDNPARRDKIAERFGELHQLLRRNCAAQAAAVIADLARAPDR